MKQDAESADAAARIARIRKLCDDLDRALESNEAQRAALIKLKNETDDAERILKSSKKSV